ncbi:MAG: type II toxin-antitoxin system VapC family toxin [Gemmatimonadota bacterium]|nr:type II toxin-antitoxin system VapC family toxin [Gemmatimonadota bacterium]
MYALDTDTCIQIIRNVGPARSRAQTYSPDELTVTSMTLAELRYGALKSINAAVEMVKVEALLDRFSQPLPFDIDAARRHAELRHALRAQPIGERDLVIASTALAQGATLVTHNVREFGRVPGLTLEDWMEPL